MSATPDDYRGALEAVERILNRGGDADDVLRAVLEVLHSRFPHFEWIGISFIEGEGEVLGPQRGESADDTVAVVPVSFKGNRVAMIEVRPGAGLTEADTELLERVATLISPYCLVGWDTGGEEWAP